MELTIHTPLQAELATPSATQRYVILLAFSP